MKRYFGGHFMKSVATIQGQILETYEARTYRSRSLYQQALQTLPGGDTRSSVFYRPYPIFMELGEGSRLRDVDGNEYLDLLNNYTTLVHGHSHPGITEVIVKQAARGTAYAAPDESQIALADALTRRVGSVDLVRFCNSGTEAVMNAVRVARAFTSRSKILKMEGGFHGTHDSVQVSVEPGSEPPVWPRGKPEGEGLSPQMVDEVLVAPFNDIETATDLIRSRQDELAAVIVEPLMGAVGALPARKEFLESLREATRQADVLLIFDEIQTFRLGVGGVQGLYGVTPDLTTFGKVIGGGLPIGAFGGRADVMGLFDPRSHAAISHSGTFNGNAITMAAGVAALELLDEDAIAHINELGDDLRRGLQGVLDESGISAHATGMGSLLHVQFATPPVQDYRSSLDDRQRIWPWLHLALLNRGIFAAARGSFNTSTVMGRAEVDRVVRAFREAIGEVKPLLAEAADLTPPPAFARNPVAH